LYNIDSLESRPFWTKDETTYAAQLTDIESYWMQIRDEGMRLLDEKGYFKDEAENLKDSGDWKQFELFARGHKIAKNCDKTPFTVS
jgi:aspartate beta-hydroxylase